MMPAAKHLDPLLGIDIHIIQPPGPVPPVPIPHPHIGIVLDPMDYVPYIGGTVTVGGLKRAQAGTSGQSVPHIPIGGVFVKPPGNEAEIFMGSSTVAVDGDAFSYLALPVLSCHDIGMPGPPRPKGSPPKSLVLPTTVVLAIPAGVLVGGGPTISLMALGMRFGMAALGKGLKKLKGMAKGSKKMKALSQRIHRAARKTMDKLGIPPSLQRRIHKAICNVTGHPVDTASGMVFTQALDFALDGPLQLRWDRDWYSNSNHVGELGHGWHHPFDMHAWEDDEVVVVRMDDGRWVPFARPDEHGAYNQRERLRLFPIVAPDEHGVPSHRGYRLEHPTGVSWVFESAKPRRIGTRTLRGFALMRVEDRCGNLIELERNYAGNLEVIRDSTGRVLELDHDTQGRIVAIWGPHPSSPTERLALARYVYDAAGDLIEARDPEDHVTRYGYRDHLLIAETDRAGMTYFFEWLGQGYDARCLRTWGDGGLYGRAFRYEPRKTTWVDSLGGEHVVELDDENRVLLERDSLGQVQVFEYDDDGALLRSVDLDGRETTYAYDELARVVAVTEPGALTTTFAYDQHDAMIEVGYPDGSKRVREYDPRGCLIGELEPDGTRWTYEVDARGLRRRDIGPDGQVLGYLWSPRGELVGFELPTGTHSFDLDSLGRTIRERTPDGSVVEHQLDRLGRLVGMRSSSGEQVRYTLDPEGRILKIEDAVGGVEVIERDRAGRAVARVDADGRRTTHQWDTEGRLLAVEDGRGRAYGFRYDGNDWPLICQDPLGRRTVFERDPAGRVLQRTELGVDGHERRLRYGYDARGRLETIERSDGHQRRVCWDALDRIVAIDDGDASVEREYDRRGNLIRERIGALELLSERERDDLRARSYPEGRRVELEHSAEGDPSRIAVDGRELARFSRDLGDRELTRESHGLIARRTWVGGGRLGSHWFEPTGDNPDPGWRRDYGYDQGARTWACRDRKFGDERYEVGRSGELWRVHDAHGQVLDLRRDATGHLAGTPGADDRAMTPEGARAHGYFWRWDAHGRLVEKRSEDGSRRWRLRWDDEGHLIGVEVEREQQSEARVELRYDGFARLVRKRVEHRDGHRVETEWLWDGVAVAGERTRSFAPAASEPELQIRDFVLDPVNLQPLAIVEPDGRALLVECDQAKAVRAAVDEQGRLAWAVDFDALGRPRAGDVDSLDRVPFRFLGQRADVDLGFNYNFHRWYDPELGAYLSPDPLGLDGGLHGWNYVPSPYDGWDPFGLFHHNDPGHYVYGLYNPSPPTAGQKPYYVGITNDPATRAGQHRDSGRLSGKGDMQVLDGPVKYGQARGYEQAYIEHFQTKTGTPGAPMGSPQKPLRGKARGNRINSFDINSPTRAKVRQKAFCDARAEKLKSLNTPCT